MSTNENNFGFFRRNLFPIHNHEFKKIFLLNFLFCLVAASYGLLRMSKDAYIVPLGGGDATSVIKFAIVLPLMILAKILYDNLSVRSSRNKMVLGLLGYFFTFFLLFQLFFKDFSRINDREIEKFSTWKKLAVSWPHVLFYFHAEAVGTFVLSVFLWGFVNSITSSEQAKRSYSTFSIGTGVSTMLAGGIGLAFNESIQKGEGLDKILFIVLGCIALTGLVYYYLASEIEKNPEAYEVPKEKKKKKRKLGAIESIRASFHSKHPMYLFLILTLVIGYAVSLNLLENLYKNVVKFLGEQEAIAQGVAVDQIKNFARAYSSKVMSWQLIGVGGSSLLFVFLLAAPIRRQGWRFTALAVPVIILLGSAIYTGVSEFNILGIKDDLELKKRLLYIGMVIVILVKSSKYVLFDTTKEAAYLPLDPETKLTGKSLVDGVGSRVGKAGGGAYFSFFGGYPLIIAITIFSVVGGWIWAVFKLARKHDDLLAQEKGGTAKKATTAGMAK